MRGHFEALRVTELTPSTVFSDEIVPAYFHRIEDLAGRVRFEQFESALCVLVGRGGQ